MPWIVCRHTKGGLHTWRLDQVCRLNLKRVLHGEQAQDEWRPIAVAETHELAMIREREIKREIRDKREALAKAHDVSYPAQMAMDDAQERDPDKKRIRLKLSPELNDGSSWLAVDTVSDAINFIKPALESMLQDHPQDFMVSTIELSDRELEQLPEV